jgi:hypothetical protein
MTIQSKPATQKYREGRDRMFQQVIQASCPDPCISTSHNHFAFLCENGFASNAPNYDPNCGNCQQEQERRKKKKIADQEANEFGRVHCCWMCGQTDDTHGQYRSEDHEFFSAAMLWPREGDPGYEGQEEIDNE